MTLYNCGRLYRLDVSLWVTFELLQIERRILGMPVRKRTACLIAQPLGAHRCMT